MLTALQREAEQAGRDPTKVELKPWQHRDLRRTARTFMARMGVSNEVAEHCLAHALPTDSGDLQSLRLPRRETRRVREAGQSRRAHHQPG
jgi:hypothetical protein